MCVKVPCFWHAGMKLSLLAKTSLSVVFLEKRVTNLPFLRQILTSKNEREPMFNVKVYVFVFRGHIFAKRVDRFR